MNENFDLKIWKIKISCFSDLREFFGHISLKFINIFNKICFKLVKFD